MPFTDEDKSELSRLITEALDNERERRRKRFLEEQAANPPRLNTKLYLITLGHHQIAFPDERGRAVLSDVFYARVTFKEDTMRGFYGGRVEVIAFGDGKLLPRPIGAEIPGGACMVEVDEGFLETLT